MDDLYPVTDGLRRFCKVQVKHHEFCFFFPPFLQKMG
jgi:hypothetical protein